MTQKQNNLLPLLPNPSFDPPKRHNRKSFPRMPILKKNATKTTQNNLKTPASTTFEVSRREKPRPLSSFPAFPEQRSVLRPPCGASFASLEAEGARGAARGGEGAQASQPPPGDSAPRGAPAAGACAASRRLYQQKCRRVLWRRSS